MNYWIFKCNPDRYNLDARLKDPEPATTWRVTRYRDEISSGDIAFIWQTGNDRGICGALTIASDPKDMPELSHELPYCIDLDSGTVLRVAAKISKRRFPGVPHTFLRVYPGLENLSVFHGFQQATNFKVSKKEGQIIMQLLSGDV